MLEPSTQTKQSSEGAVRMIIGKAESQELDTRGLAVNTTSASSLFFLAFLYFTVPWEAKPGAIAEIYT